MYFGNMMGLKQLKEGQAYISDLTNDSRPTCGA